jgi:hypothetical protein
MSLFADSSALSIGSAHNSVRAFRLIEYAEDSAGNGSQVQKNA